MGVNELIDNLRMPSWHDLEDPDATLLADAADALSTLQAENKRMRAELDAAIKQLHGNCNACAYYTSSHNQGPCSECKYEYYLYPCDAMKDNWGWCGPEKED